MIDAVVGDIIYYRDPLSDEQWLPGKIVGFATVKNRGMIVLESKFSLDKYVLVKATETSRQIQ